MAGFFTAAIAAAGVNTFNKYADRERDKIIWPSRSIPSGRVKANQALLLSLLYYAIALALCWIIFNPLAFYLLLAAITLGSLYSSILRDKVGYLSLPLIEGLIFLCGWACFSPQTLMTSVLPWYLYFMGVIWQTAHILAHYILHIRYDAAGKPVIQTPVLFSRPLPPKISRLILVFAVILTIMAVLLPLFTSLSLLYIVPVGAFGIYTIYQCAVLIKAPSDQGKLHRAWSSLSLFRMIISAGAVVGVLVY